MSLLDRPAVNVGLLGLGTVGTGVYNILKKEAAEIERKTGVRLVMRHVCDKFISRDRQKIFPKSLFTRDPEDLLKDPSLHILVELIGGLRPAEDILKRAIAGGKHVVTANKALLAERGDFLFKQKSFGQTYVGIEASVCGAIPILKAIEESLASNNLTSVLGIVNGTCNYILTQMTSQGMDFAEALAQAQAKGYAERDSRLDVEGIDSAHKLAVLARLAFRTRIPFGQIHIEGISKITSFDIQYAMEMGYAIKLLAIAKKTEAGLELRVHPTLLTAEHPLASVKGVFNAVFVSADQAGDLLFYGRGAGMYPAASAVAGDIVDIAKRITVGDSRRGLFVEAERRFPVIPVDQLKSGYYLRFQVMDRPEMLGRIAKALGQHHISIRSVQQKQTHQSKSVPVVILTYQALERDLRKALRIIDAQKEVAQKTVVIRVES
ncbi:MAG: homoserine dehydrogenase [Candidatus Omnitrophota bacterium]